MIPKLKAYTLASRTQPKHKAKLAKEYSFANPKRRMNTPYNKRYEAILPIGRTGSYPNRQFVQKHRYSVCVRASTPYFLILTLCGSSSPILLTG